MIPPTYKPKKKFMQLAIAEAKRARDRGDYPIGAVITRLIGKREVVIASAGNRVKTSGSSIKHVELETLKYVSSGYGRYLPDFVLYSTHEPCAMCAGACVWSKIGAVVFGVSQEDITAYGKKHGTEEFKWRACLISCKFVLEKGGLHIPVFDNFLRPGVPKVIRISEPPDVPRPSRAAPARSRYASAFFRNLSVLSHAVFADAASYTSGRASFMNAWCAS